MACSAGDEHSLSLLSPAGNNFLTGYLVLAKHDNCCWSSVCAARFASKPAYCSCRREMSDDILELACLTC